VSTINDQTVVELAQKSVPYQAQMFASEFRIRGDKFYSLVVSNFKAGEKLAGILELESNTPLSVRVIGAEGSGMITQF